jgi:hypothetical protein
VNRFDEPLTSEQLQALVQPVLSASEALEAEHGRLRELVRHRAKLVAWRIALKASVHAVLAKQGVHLKVTDLFGIGGRKLLAAAPLDAAYRLRVNALCRLIDAMDFEIRAVAGPLRVALTGHPGFSAVQGVPGSGGSRARSCAQAPTVVEGCDGRAGMLPDEAMACDAD